VHPPSSPSHPHASRGLGRCHLSLQGLPFPAAAWGAVSTPSSVKGFPPRARHPCRPSVCSLERERVLKVVQSGEALRSRQARQKVATQYAAREEGQLERGSLFRCGEA
jgi:hypothetical protein